MSMSRALLFFTALACMALSGLYGFSDDGTGGDKPLPAPRRDASPVPAATGTGVNRADRSHRVLRDLRYGDESNGVRNMLDLYLPDEATGKTPVVIAVHGGALRRGRKEMFRPKAVKLAERGYAVAAVNYRLSPEHYLPAQIHDVKAAVRWVRAHAADYGLDPDRIGVIGGSAGATIAAAMGTSGDAEALEGEIGGHPGVSTKVQAVVAMAGVYREFPWMVGRRATDPDGRMLATLCAPITYVSRGDPPFLLMIGDKDPTPGGVADHERFHEALKDEGVDSTLLIVPGAEHGDCFDRECDRILEFFDRHLVAAARMQARAYVGYTAFNLRNYDLYRLHELAGLRWFFYDKVAPPTWYGAAYWPELLEKHRQIARDIIGGRSISSQEKGDAAPQAAIGDARTATAEPRTGSRLGIGFLWTRQSRALAGELTSEQDFVDVILDPGKLDIFDTVKRPVRVACISLALQKTPARPLPGIKETIETLRQADVPPERVIIAYNPERSPGTPSSELDDLVASARAAKAMAEAYGAPLLVGPGLGEMMTREALYPELAKICDFWLIQSQRLQLDADTRKPVDPAKYRTKVKRIVDILRQANPKIRIFVQVVTTAERGTTVLTAEQVAAFALAIEDIVDAVRIYGAPGDLLAQIIERLHAPRSARSTPEDPAK